MVTIKKIEIKGFFGKGDFEWNLDPVVNILGGKNGSGKSTIFKFCYSLLTSERMPDKYETDIKKVFQEVLLTLSNDWTLRWSTDIEPNTVVLHMDGGIPKPFRQNSVVKDETGKVRDFSDLQSLIKVCLINSFEQHVDKAVSYEQQPKSQPLDDPTMLDLLIKDQIDSRNKDFSETMERFIDAAEDDQEGRNQYTQNYKKIYSTLNHFFQEYDKKIGSSFELVKDGNKIGYEHLSMGEKQILLLMLMVSNTKQAPCIFFMDEPDLSMHIDWKEILVKELHELNPNMQIILSTHAPSVITGWHDRVREVSQLIKK